MTKFIILPTDFGRTLIHELGGYPANINAKTQIFLHQAYKMEPLSISVRLPKQPFIWVQKEGIDENFHICRSQSVPGDTPTTSRGRPLFIRAHLDSQIHLLEHLVLFADCVEHPLFTLSALLNHSYTRFCYRTACTLAIKNVALEPIRLRRDDVIMISVSFFSSAVDWMPASNLQLQLDLLYRIYTERNEIAKLQISANEFICAWVVVIYEISHYSYFHASGGHCSKETWVYIDVTGLNRTSLTLVTVTSADYLLARFVLSVQCGANNCGLGNILCMSPFALNGSGGEEGGMGGYMTIDIDEVLALFLKLSE
ncbi:hypothetical protein R3P38DRAFT_2809868 [Favolaschia claudopus]|uniref:Uncharacterized protein n=1 Tax=Favolaschia claudopus TaxID=2862362 RepID=A0AAV9Z8T6_9AGAR